MGDLLGPGFGPVGTLVAPGNHTSSVGNPGGRPLHHLTNAPWTSTSFHQPSGRVPSGGQHRQGHAPKRAQRLGWEPGPDLLDTLVLSGVSLNDATNFGLEAIDFTRSWRRTATKGEIR